MNLKEKKSYVVNYGNLIDNMYINESGLISYLNYARFDTKKEANKLMKKYNEKHNNLLYVREIILIPSELIKQNYY